MWVPEIEFSRIWVCFFLCALGAPINQNIEGPNAKDEFYQRYSEVYPKYYFLSMLFLSMLFFRYQYVAEILSNSHRQQMQQFTVPG